MQLRKRQKDFVEKSLSALYDNGNTLAVAPTGAGKTVCLSAVVDEVVSSHPDRPHLVLQHRDELVAQNRLTFSRISDHRTTVVDAGTKDWSGPVVFGMVQTVARNLDSLPALSGITIDEAHHSAAPSYRKIIAAAQKFPTAPLLYGVTATPNRGDSKSLLGVFDNCADQITIGELIESGFLVPPKVKVVDVGVQDDLSRVRRLASDFDMSEVEAIMNKSALNERVVGEWEKAAGDRQTVVFCSTVQHAKDINSAFMSAGVMSGVVWGDMGANARQETLDAYANGQLQVLVNVAVLTEGWDDQPTSCVILLRPCSYKSTMMQMIGRGLRKVDPELHPGVRKDDCVVLDFGTSILTHGDILTSVDLAQDGAKDCPSCEATIPVQCSECPVCAHEFPKMEGPQKFCPECNHPNPINARECHNCGELFPPGDSEDGVLSEFHMTEVDVLQASPYKWTPLFNGAVVVAAAFNAWAAVVFYRGRFYALGGGKGMKMRLLGDSEDRILSLVSADDFLRETGDDESANKTKRWLNLPATTKQISLLGLDPLTSMGMTRYEASCRLSWKFSERGIRQRLESMYAEAA